MKTSLIRNAFMLAIALVGFGPASLAQTKHTICEAVLNDGYVLFEELITAGSEVTGFSDRAFHARFATAKQDYFARYAREVRPLIQDNLLIPHFLPETIVQNIQGWQSPRFKKEVERVYTQLAQVITAEDRLKLFLFASGCGCFFAPYAPHGDRLVGNLTENEQKVMKGLYLFGIFKLFALLYDREPLLAQKMYDLGAKNQYSPLYPIVKSFSRPFSGGDSFQSLIDTLDHGLCIMIGKCYAGNKVSTSPCTSCDGGSSDAIVRLARMMGATKCVAALESSK